MLRLRACDEILKRGIADEKEAGMLEDAMEDGRLQPLYQRYSLDAVCGLPHHRTPHISPGNGIDETFSYDVLIFRNNHSVHVSLSFPLLYPSHYFKTCALPVPDLKPASIAISQVETARQVPESDGRRAVIVRSKLFP